MSEPMEFDGADYVPERDNPRLEPQFQRIWRVMSDGQFRTLDEISRLASAPQASVSAQLRHMRKRRFGSHTVNRRHRGDGAMGLYEYQLVENPEPTTGDDEHNDDANDHDPVTT